MSEFDYNDYGTYDPNAGAYDAGFDGGITSDDLARVAESAGAAGAARAMAELAQAQQQQTQWNIDQQSGQTLAEAERALNAHDPSWPTKKLYAAQVLQEHPSLLPQSALFDAEAAAEALWNAAEIGLATERDARAQAKRADDDASFARIKAQASKSWSARMAEAGTSVHDILNGD
ncbi:MAG TPA: hypothetical protein DEV93_18570 [Chloroflexi bacterium]|nr:hypothetical protein [Chloroflexota bacterium]